MGQRSMTSAYETTTGHRKHPHCDGNCGGTCVYCTLFICTICGGAEGSLLPFCPGQPLTADAHDRNYSNYCRGTGAFARLTEETLTLARDACYNRCHPIPGVITSGGAKKLYDAVVALWRLHCVKVI